MCLVGFTGEFCENNVTAGGDWNSSGVSNGPEWNLFDQIQQGKFDFDEYMQNEYGNVSEPSGDDLQKQSIVSSNMLEGQFNVSYDEFVTRLVDELWVDINKEGMYLFMYNFSQVFNESNVPGALDLLRFYSRYVLFNLDTQVGQLEQALDSLVAGFGNSSIKLNAIQNVESIHDSVRTGFVRGWNGGKKIAVVDVLPQPIEVHQHVLNRTEYLSAIKKDLNRTVCGTNKLFNSYIAPAEKYTVEQTNKFLEKLHNYTVSNWNMMIDYGFKYFTYKLSGNPIVSAPGIDGNQRTTVVVKRTSESVFQVHEF
jgi:hypothetical protein